MAADESVSFLAADAQRAPEVRTVRLASGADFAGFRRACRELWAEQVAPARVVWQCADDAEGDLFEAGAQPAAAAGAAQPPPPPPVYVPAAFLPLAESAILHSDPGRFALLYRLVWRLQTEPGLRADPLDPDWLRADELAQEVRRELHKIAAGDGSVTMASKIPTDPKRRPATEPQPTPGHRLTPGGEAPRSLRALGEALQRCRECPIGEHATQAVGGEGGKHAPLMFVGEQPGDQEDLQGRPFVGPAGQLLARALEELAIPRDDVYITNAVKHFKFELRGKRRIHKTPAQQEAAACLHWLESEIELVDPAALVALGATAARQLMGTTVSVLRERGRWLVRSDGRRVLVTLHPSALLRMDPGDKAAAYAAWLADLRHAAEHFAAAAASRR